MPKRMSKQGGIGWDAGRVRALRKYLGLSQQEMAQEMGIRQQTVSEWETGAYAPRGASVRLLSMVAEQRRFYEVQDGSKDEQ